MAPSSPVFGSLSSIPGVRLKPLEGSDDVDETNGQCAVGMETDAAKKEKTRELNENSSAMGHAPALVNVVSKLESMPFGEATFFRDE